MKKLVQINSVCRGSTGKIMLAIQQMADTEGYETISYYGRGTCANDVKTYKFGTESSFVADVLFTFLFGKQGAVACFQTKKLLEGLEKEKPDIIHLHNIHGYYLNYPMLFEWLKKEYHGKIIWTLHDCWAFTGHCPHFTYAACEKWKTQCRKCPQYHGYPFSWFFDTSKSEFDSKKLCFSEGNLDLTILVPSDWLGNLVEKSFLKKYPRYVINNWVDFEVFRNKENTGIRKKYGIAENKKILLGVSSIWEKRKGWDMFLELSRSISEEYVIVLVGVNKRQKKSLPSNIIGILRTENQDELAAIYSEAYVFLNPSVEETFSLVTLEALACNVPVIVLDSSAVHEMVNEKNGIVLHESTAVEFKDAIDGIKRINRESENIRKTVLRYNKEEQIRKILDIYEKGE